MLKNYLEIREWLESFIPLVYGKEELGLARIENLLKKLGNPEKKFKSILVGGTSGKGTTAYMIARILQSCNFKFQISNFQINSKIKNEKNFKTKKLKVGLHISPHLIDIRERMQIFQCQMSNVKCQMSDKLIPMGRFVGLANEIK